MAFIGKGMPAVAPSSFRIARSTPVELASMSSATWFWAALRVLPSAEESGGRPSPKGAVPVLVSDSGTTRIPITAAGLIPGAPSRTAQWPMNDWSVRTTAGVSGSSARSCCSVACWSGTGS